MYSSGGDLLVSFHVSSVEMASYSAFRGILVAEILVVSHMGCFKI